MPISNEKVKRIEALLEKKIEDKLKKYSRETASMPFLVRLVQDSKRVASYSFIHSLATTLGMSIYEEVSVILADGNCDECFRNFDLGGVVSKDQLSTIDEIIRQLRNNERKPNYEKDVELILSSSKENAKPQKEGRIADFYMLRNDIEYYFEIKTAKPNIDVFRASKAKLLQWVARKRKYIKTFLAIPYNPYHPNPYNRFTQQNVMEPGIDFIVADEYWNMLSGKNTYPQLLDIFDKVGKCWKSSVLEKIDNIARTQLEDF